MASRRIAGRCLAGGRMAAHHLVGYRLIELEMPAGTSAGVAVAAQKAILIRTSESRSTQMYSMYEALARERMQDQLARAARRRLSQQLVSAHRWRRLAAYSTRRAARSDRRLAEQSAADFQLVG
jgi:hypothetical protein